MLLSDNMHSAQAARSSMHKPQLNLVCEAKHLQGNLFAVHVRAGLFGIIKFFFNNVYRKAHNFSTIKLHSLNKISSHKGKMTKI